MNLEDELEEVRRLIKEGFGYNEAIEKVMSYRLSDNSKQSVQVLNTISIIADNEDIDNNEIYDTETGLTKRDLI